MFTLEFNGTTHNETFDTKKEVMDRLRQFSQSDLSRLDDRPVAISRNGQQLAIIGNIGIKSAKTGWREVRIR